MNQRLTTSIILISFLTACGGGGGGGGGGTGGGGGVTPPITIANTANVHYLPLANGNSWTFASGGKMVDMGTYTLTCSCPDNNGSMERIALYDPGAVTISGSFFFTKTLPSSQFGELSNVVGVENDAGTNNIILASYAQFPNGLPVMDDSPSANEFWNDGHGDLSTITSVGGTMILPNQTEVINIATDQITGNFSPTTWSFAKGVGFTQIGVGAQSTSLTSFFINATTSLSVSGTRYARGSLGTIDAGAVLRKLFK